MCNSRQEVEFFGLLLGPCKTLSSGGLHSDTEIQNSSSTSPLNADKNTSLPPNTYKTRVSVQRESISST